MQQDEAVRRLRAAGCVAAEDEAAELITAADDPGTLDRWVARREQGEPLAWIIGRASFCDQRVSIDSGVYVPRPHTEQLARRAAQQLAARPGGRAVDVCTGSGAIAAHLRTAVPEASVIGIDVDPVAVACARRNHVTALVGDLCAPLRDGSVDVVVAVAPYVPTRELPFLPADVQRYEARHALDGGADGLDIVRRIVVEAARLLRPGGWLGLELGGNQIDTLPEVLHARGFSAPIPWFDEDDELRGAEAVLAERRR